MLTKALRPLPEKWHGLQDPELQQRQRYLHLIADDEPRRAFLTRARSCCSRCAACSTSGVRRGRDARAAAGRRRRAARPFVTHHHALDIDLYLRISLELYLKRLLVGGLERVYEIGRNFRNEGIDRDAQPRVHDARGLPGLRRLRRR